MWGSKLNLTQFFDILCCYCRIWMFHCRLYNNVPVFFFVFFYILLYFIHHIVYRDPFDIIFYCSCIFIIRSVGTEKNWFAIGCRNWFVLCKSHRWYFMCMWTSTSTLSHFVKIARHRLKLQPHAKKRQHKSEK